MNRKDKCALVNRPFSNWTSHSSLRYHHNCLEKADALESSVDNLASRVDDGTIQSRLFAKLLCEQYFFS